MFNPKKPDGTHTAAANADAARPASPMNSRSNYKVDSSTHSVVDVGLTMKGELESEGDILVKGKVIGNIRCKLLIIEIDALVEGGVEAEEVVVRGNTKGTLRAERVRLEKTANVDSEVYHCSFAAEEGARIRGSLRSKDEPLDQQPNDAQVKANGSAKGSGRSKEQSLNGHTEVTEGSAA